MRHKNYILTLFFFLVAFAAWAQVCPGPAQRQALINLQKSGILNGTRAYQIPMTDTCGNQRYVTIDSIITIVVDSIGSDTALQHNWYTHDGTTVNPLRTATIDSAAQWIGNNADGFLYFQMGTLAGGRAYVDTDESSIYFGDLGGVNTVETNTTGIDITTSATASRAVDLTTDTVNMIASFDPALMTVNLLSDGTYFAADSLKVVGIGQFPGFPSLNYDGTEKGFYYNPSNEELYIIGGNGSENIYSLWGVGPNYAQGFVAGDAGNTQISNTIEYTAIGNIGSISQNITTSDGTHGIAKTVLQSGNPANASNLWGAAHLEKDTNLTISTYLGESSVTNNYYQGRRAWGVRVLVKEGELATPFDWIQSYLPNDTTENAVSFYNRAYFWKNEHPTGAAGDTLFHFWAATGAGGEAGSDPGFMTLDSIRGPGGGDNWYTADGTTTDNTRIADVLETATWRSDDSTLDGLVPFRWEITGIMNEPEMMVWYFDNTADSLLLSHSDVEIVLNSSTSLVLSADAALNILSDDNISMVADDSISIFSNTKVYIGGDSLRIYNGTLQSSDEGDILAVVGADASNRTVKTLEGTFDAEMLSWSAGAAGDKWEAVPANRWSITSTNASVTPSISVPYIIVDSTGGGTISLNYTPGMPSAAYTTIRYIYNAGSAATTVNTDQSWKFRDETGDIGTSFSLGAEQSATLIWIYNATASAARFFVVRSDGLSHWTESFSSATEATSAFTATNAATDVNAAIIPKGTGAFLLDMPDGASTGGNARGTSAVDLQMERSAAAQVASGNYSALLGGRRNIASGAGSFCIGGTTGFAVGSVASGTNSGTIGNSDTASATACYAIGQTSTASGDYATAIGLQALASHRGQNAFSSLDAGGVGFAQNSMMRVNTSVTGTSQTELFLDGTSGSERMTLVGNQFWNATIQVIAVTSTAGSGTGTLGDTYVATYTVGIKRLGATTSLVGAVQTMSAAQADAGINDAVFTIDADDTNEALRIRFTPPTSAAGDTVTEAYATIYVSELRY